MPNPFKQEMKQEEVKKSAVPASQEEVKAPSVLLSKTDAYVYERIKSQPKSREEVDLTIEHKPDPNRHRLTLPPELEPFKEKYTFRWIFKNERAISEACDIKGWVLVNRVHFPELPNHLFSVTGSIERGDMICGFMPNKKAENLRREVGLKSKELVKSRINAHEDNPDFYVPKDNTEEGKPSKVIGL